MAEKKEAATKTAAKSSSTSETTSSNTGSSSKSGGHTAGVVVGILVLLGLIGGIWYLSQMSPQETDENNEEEQMEKTYPDPVATVDGQEISLKEFQDRLQEFTNNAQAQGLDISDEAVVSELETQAMTSLVNTKILLKAAVEAEISVTEEEIEAAYQRAAESLGGEEGLQSALSDLGFTEEELRADIEEQLMIDAYIQQTTDYQNVTVTDEELETLYADLKAASPDIPPLEEILEDFRAQQVQQKQQTLVNDLIESLRGEANIEVMIE